MVVEPTGRSLFNASFGDPARFVLPGGKIATSSLRFPPSGRPVGANRQRLAGVHVDLVDVPPVVAEIGDGVDRPVGERQGLRLRRDVVRLVAIGRRQVRGRAVRELHRSRDVEQPEARQAIAPLARGINEPPSGVLEDPHDLGRRELGVPREQHRRGGADVRRRERRAHDRAVRLHHVAGRSVEGRSRRRERARNRRDDADARRGDVVEDRVAVGERGPREGGRDGRDADHVAKRRRPARVDAVVIRRVADRRHHDRALLEGVGDRVALGTRELVQAGILGVAVAAQREVDHLRAGAHRVPDRRRLGFRVDVAAADHAVVDQLDVGRPDARAADAVVGVRSDDAGDRSAVQQRRARIVRLVDGRERHCAGEIRARAIDAAVDHRHRHRCVLRRRQRVRIPERVDRAEVPLACRQGVGGRPGKGAHSHAHLWRERAEEAPRAAPASAPAPVSGPDGKAERSVRACPCARNPGPAAADHVLERHDAARAASGTAARAAARPGGRGGPAPSGGSRERARDESDPATRR